MFFRLWFLYLVKLGFLGFAIVFLGFLIPPEPWGDAVFRSGLFLIIPIGVIGAAIGIWLCISNRIRCPLCGKLGRFVTIGRSHPAVDCLNCGVVYPRNLLFSFQLQCDSVDGQDYDCAKSDEPDVEE
jgi:hypothetical protein